MSEAKEVKEMRKIFERFLKQHGRKLCAAAVAMASIAPKCCRGYWYQAEEPEGLEEFMKAHKK